MCEALISALSGTNPDPVKDREGTYKKGYTVVVFPDGHPWTANEGRPDFVIIKFPLIPISKVVKYTIQELSGLGDEARLYRRRKWIIRWDSLPQHAKDRLKNDGELIIKAAAAYDGPYDYTWSQVKSYYRNQELGIDETEDLE